MCVECFACIHVYAPQANTYMRPDEGVSPLELELPMFVTGMQVPGSEPGPLQEQGLLTTEPSPFFFFDRVPLCNSLGCPGT